MRVCLILLCLLLSAGPWAAAQVPMEVDADLDTAERRLPVTDIHFDHQSAGLTRSAEEALERLAAWLEANPDFGLRIEGHASRNEGDDKATSELGRRRAVAARSFLESQGVESGRLETVSHGEERPVCTDDDKECWQRNRRAHFAL